MHSSRFSTLWAVLLAPATLLAQQSSSSGTITVGGGGSLLDGDRPSFQQVMQQKKDGYGGIEEFKVTSEAKDSVFKFEARLLPGNDDYRVAIRYDKNDRYYVDAGYEQFRVWSDGSGGVFLPMNVSFVMFNEDLSLSRAKLWAEFGAWTADKTLFKFRWERRTRNGTKSSTHWADSNLVGTFGTRSIVPTFYDVDDQTDDFSISVSNTSKEDVKWGATLRYTDTKIDDRRYERRRPFETADRIVTHKDESKNDIFTAHGFYEKKVSEQLTVTAGALRTTLDGVIEGSRIYGQTYDPVYDPAYLRRQQRDEGYYNLEGTSEIKQTILNANAVYLPAKHWSVRGSLRFENSHQETIAEFVETNIGAGPAFAAILEDVEGEHKKSWDEWGEGLEVRYTGQPNVVYSAKAEWIQGQGDHEEERMIHHTGQLTVDRDLEYKRNSQKYSLGANWYFRPGLTLAAQYYWKGNTNDYNARRDNTSNILTSGDRYPAFITDQDFETNDFNVRLSWRPVTGLNLVSRYDYQKGKIISQDAGLGKVDSAEMKSHILSQSATWSPAGSYYFTGNVNVTYDTLTTPTLAFTQNQDNNYVNASLGGGWVVGKQDDLYADYSWFRANNFIDRSATLIPFGLSQKTQQASLTWVRRQSENLLYTVKYGYVTNRDQTWAGLNDFDAHVIYAKVQYKF
ncbi:MAG: hypothetical protein HZC55_17600 [Verrucomicrobia bacterium]|nr:hypothetical protein [Verrucomicrobiota bacterium]